MAPSGNVLFIQAGTWHEQWHNASEQQSGYRLAFSQSLLQETALLTEWPPVIPISGLHTIKTLFVRLQQEKDQPNTEQTAPHLIGLILALLSRSTENPLPTAIRNREDTIQEIKLYMEDNHSRPLTLETLSEEFNINKYQLARLFMQHTGISPLQYIISCRMDTAKQLLVTTKSQVAEIASQVGYKSAPQFQAAFKKAFGITPRHYRLEFNQKD